MSRQKRWHARERLRAWEALKRAQDGSQAPANCAALAQVDSSGYLDEQRIQPVYHLDVPEQMTLERRPTRDDREEPRPQLRTADGRTLALVESVDPTDLAN